MDDYMDLLPDCEWCGAEDDGDGNIFSIKRFGSNTVIVSICRKCFGKNKHIEN